MTLLPHALPLSDHRARVEQYLQGIEFSFSAVAGQIIEERLSLSCARDPVRPCLVLWACAAANGSEVGDALPVAAAFDLFDRFMLLHEELAEESAPMVTRWGLGQSLNAGDAFYAVAFRTLASDVHRADRRLQAARLVGQAVLEAIERPGGDIRANGVLTAAALQAGAIVAGASESVTRSFGRAGRLLGVAAATEDCALAQRLGRQAVAALTRHARRADLQALEEVTLYFAQRAA
jgi:geranylgeranyl pyrophosphate synthase